MGWTYKTYRCEWVTEVYAVDQYGQRPRDAEVFYEQAWPDRDAALADLDRVSSPHAHVPGRRVSDLARHAYYDCGVRYREVEVIHE